MAGKVNKFGIAPEALADIPKLTGGFVLANKDESVKLTAITPNMRQWTMTNDVSAAKIKEVLAKKVNDHKGWHLVKQK